MRHKNSIPGRGTNKTALFKRFLLCIFGSVLRAFIFTTLFTPYNFIQGIQIMKSQAVLGKLIMLGSILDLIVFAVLLKLNKGHIAPGVVLAVIVFNPFDFVYLKIIPDLLD